MHVGCHVAISLYSYSSHSSSYSLSSSSSSSPNSPVAISSVFCRNFKWVFYEPVLIGFRFQCSLVLRYSSDGNIINYLECVNKLEQVKTVKILYDKHTQQDTARNSLYHLVYRLKYNMEIPSRLLMFIHTLTLIHCIIKHYESLLILLFNVISCS